MLGLLTVSSAGLLLPQDGVLNFRRVSPSLPGLYRSAALEQASERDAARILDSAKVRTLIDLRSEDEIERAACAATSAGARLIEAYDRGAPVGAGCLASEGCGHLRRIHVPLLGDVEVPAPPIHAPPAAPLALCAAYASAATPPQAFFEEIERRMPAQRKAKAMVLRGFSGKAYDQMLYDEVTNGGHDLLYTAMLKSAPEAFGQALAVAADRSKGGVLIHCAKGKDRTGVLAALLQHAAGDNEQEIVDAYTRSEHLLSVRSLEQAAGASADGVSSGVDWSKLSGSPRKAVLETFQWLRNEYGAIDRYLQLVGCGEEWRRVLLDSQRLNAHL